MLVPLFLIVELDGENCGIVLHFLSNQSPDFFPIFFRGPVTLKLKCNKPGASRFHEGGFENQMRIFFT